MVESRLLQEDVVSVIFDTEKKGTAQAEGDDSSRKTSVESTAALTAASSFDENDLLPGRKISNSVLDSVEDCPSDDQEVETENKSSRRELQHCSSLTTLMTLTKLSLDQHTIKEHFVTGSSVITANTGTNNKAQENIFLASVGESRKSVGDCNFVASTTRTTATVGSTAINTLGISTSSASLLRGAGTDTKGEAKSRFKDDSEHQEEAAPVESRVRFIKEVAVETERSVQSGAQVAHQRITKEEEQRRRQVILETGQKAQCAFPSSEAPPPIGLRISAQAMHPQNQGGTHTRGYHGQPQHQQRNTPRGHSDNLSISSDGHRLTMGSFRAGSMGGRDGAHSIDSTGVPPPTPLFDRLLSEEVQEMKLYAKIIKDQNQRLAELEDIHHNLEARLEMQTRERMELEEKLSENERKWEMRCAELEKERDDALKNVEMEKSANKGLLEHVSRTNKEMQRRKYGTGPQRHPHQRENLRPRGGESDIRRVPSAERGVSARELSPTLQHAKMNKKSNLHESPHELLASSGNTEAVQQRNVTNSLLDFFGITEPNSSS